MSTLRFALRVDKPDKSSKCPIELIYQVSGQRKKVFLPKRFKVNSVNWNSDSQRAIYVSAPEAKRNLKKELHKALDQITITESEANDINDHIKGVQVAIAEIEKRYAANKVAYTANMVIKEYNDSRTPETKKESHRDQVPDFIDLYIETHSPHRAPGSLNVYRSLKRYLIAYRDDKKCSLNFETIDYTFFQRFQNFLIGMTKIDDEGNTSPVLNNTTIAKSLKTLKALLYYAKLTGITVNDSFREFKIKSEKLEVIALTELEFKKLQRMDLSDNKRLDQVRDVFIFSCSTGLRVSDMQHLKRENIKEDYIAIKVKKTKDDLTIPLNSISATILHKYSKNHKPLPLISPQKLNMYLKELCKKAEIDELVEIVRFRGNVREAITYPKYELIHIHTGRKTFCTLSLEKGMAAHEVMEISGHKDQRSFARYVNVTENRKKVVMVKAWGEVPKLKVIG